MPTLDWIEKKVVLNQNSLAISSQLSAGLALSFAAMKSLWSR
jgi:hypothetical protein